MGCPLGAIVLALDLELQVDADRWPGGLIWVGSDDCRLAMAREYEEVTMPVVWPSLSRTIWVCCPPIPLLLILAAVIDGPPWIGHAVAQIWIGYAADGADGFSKGEWMELLELWIWIRCGKSPLAGSIHAGC
ncbi:hypothetical protein ACLOJK_006765 [Asimina triloba]